MSEALRQVVWKCDRCGGDAQAIFGIFPSCKCGSTSFKAAQPPAPTAQPVFVDHPCVPTGFVDHEMETVSDNAAQQPTAEPFQGGMDNAELLAAWKKKLPGVEPSDTQLTAFSVGVEVGFARARDLERQDWSRVHHALAKHGAHPGRTDDHLADVIDRALAAPAQRQPLSEVQIHAMKCAAADQGITGIAPSLHLARAVEAAHGITAAPAAQKGEKL